MLPNDPQALPFIRAAQDASGSSLGSILEAPAVTGPGVVLRPPAGVQGLGALSPAGSSYLSLAGSAVVGAGIGYAASRRGRGAGIGAGLQLALAAALNIATTRGMVSGGTHAVQAIAGLSGLALAGMLLARK